MSIWHSSRSSPTPHSYAESGSYSRHAARSDFLTFLDTARAIAAGVSDPQSYGWSWQGPGYPILLAPLTLLGGSVASHDICRQHGTRPTNDLALVPDRYEPIRCSRWTPSPRLSRRSIRDSGCGHHSLVPKTSRFRSSWAIAYLLISGTPSWRLPVLGVLTCGLVFVRPTMLFYVLIVGFTVMALAPAGRKGLAAALLVVIRRFDSCKRHRRPIRRR